jgi:hypothetical protein
LIILGFFVYMFLRLRKIDARSLFRRKTPGDEPKSWDQFSYTQNGGARLSGEKSMVESNVSRFYQPSNSGYSNAQLQGQDFGNSALLQNAAAFGTSPAPQIIYVPAAQMSTFYNPETPADAYLPKQNMYRASELSSLSSGFGDAEIDVPESGPTTQQTTRTSLLYRTAPPLVSRFSWTTTTTQDVVEREQIPAGNRDTIYTQNSEAPRFRSIQSWVGQQASRVERQLTKKSDIPPMPPMPPIPPIPESSSVSHRRLDSEDPAFQVHPGQEVEVGRGSRVPSSVLDRKLWTRSRGSDLK